MSSETKTETHDLPAWDSHPCAIALRAWADEMDRLYRELLVKDAELARLQAVVKKLPRDRRGEPVIPQQVVYQVVNGEIFEFDVAGVYNEASEREAWAVAIEFDRLDGPWSVSPIVPVSDCHSTRAAAEAARTTTKE